MSYKIATNIGCIEDVTEIDVFRLPHINALSNVHSLRTNAVVDETNLVVCVNEDIVEITLNQAAFFELRSLEEIKNLQVKIIFPELGSKTK